MNIVISLNSSGVIGWTANLVMPPNGRQEILPSILVGMAGTAFGGLLISPVLGAPALNQSGNVSLAAAAVLLGGALVLVAIFNPFLRGRVR